MPGPLKVSSGPLSLSFRMTCAQLRSSLKDTWRQSEVDEALIMQEESDLRDLLNTSAQLTAVAESLRLHRRVFRLTVSL